MVYAVTNPVKAGLVKKASQWPGWVTAPQELDGRPLTAKRSGFSGKFTQGGDAVVLLALPPREVPMHRCLTILALCAVTTGPAHAAQGRPAAPARASANPCAFGAPQTSRAGIAIKRIVRGHSVIGYDVVLRAPRWACEVVIKGETLDQGSPPAQLQPDPRLARSAQVSLADLRRRKLVPGFLLDPFALRGASALPRRFLSNVVALRSKHSLARYFRKRKAGNPLHRLHEHARDWADKYRQVWVVTGPIFGRPAIGRPGAPAVPTHFFKILVRRDQWRTKTLALVVPNRARRPRETLRSRRRSIAWVEQRTGLRFFPKMPAARARRVKARKGAWWPLPLQIEDSLSALGGGSRQSHGFSVGKYPRAKARVFMARATVTGGGLDKATIRRVVRRHLLELKTCYQRHGLKTNTRLKGMVAVRFELGARGTVASAALHKTTLNHLATETCILGAVRKWRFPIPEGGLPRITYPFHFAPPTP